MPETDIQQQQIEGLGHADIVLGVFSYDSAGTVGQVVRAAQEALFSCFPDTRGVLINVDAGSRDGTPSVAADAALDKNSFVQVANPMPRLASVEQYGMPGKATAYQTIFGAVGKLNARACAVIDANLSTFSREWVERLIHPVFEQQFDWVSPCYLRHKYDGPILNGIVYPLTRALYGKRVRQPIGGEFAFSGKLVEHLMGSPQSELSAGFGADAWFSTRAFCGDFRLAQAFLGPRILNHTEPTPDVSTVLADVLGPLFTEMSQTASIWQRIRHSEVVPTFGSGCDQMSDGDPEPAPVDPSPMVESFRLGYQNLQDIWRIVLPPATLVELKRMSFYNAEIFRFDDVIWARIVYDFALAYRMRTIDRNHLLRALTPIYLGWVAAYVLSVREKSANETQARIEALCLSFEAQKSYLISRWRWPDRFNP